MKADLNHILEFVKKRPGMYLRKNSIYDLATFICGYEVALWSNFDLSDGKEISFMKWVERRYEISNPAWHWSRILHHVAGSEKAAMKLFFELWPEYYSEKENFTDKCFHYYGSPPTASVTNEHWNEMLNQSWNT